MQWVIPLFGAGVAIGVLFWLYQDLDFARFLAELTMARPVWILVLGATILAEQWLRGWKWRQILHDVKPISTRRLFGAILAGYGVGALIPLGISPLVRSWLIARLEGLRLASVLVTAAIERFIDGIVFGLIVAVVAIVGRIPSSEADLRLGLGVAGGLNLALFAGLLWLLFRAREALSRPDSRTARVIERVAKMGGARFAELRAAIAEGITWPRARARQIGIVAASFAMKAVAASHFLWAGLALGVRLELFDYLFLLVFAGFALVLARFIRVPGGFVIGSAYALKLIGVADEQALAMIMFNNVVSLLLMVGIGGIVFWRSGVEISSLGDIGGHRDERA